MKSIYLIGSLRNSVIPKIGAKLRDLDFDVFDDWFAGGERADDAWKVYEQARGRSYIEALKGHAATHVFSFDRYHLDRCDIAILVLPAGKSGHLEFGYVRGQGKPGFILLDDQDVRWDVMYQFATKVVDSVGNLIEELEEL